MSRGGLVPNDSKPLGYLTVVAWKSWGNPISFVVKKAKDGKLGYEGTKLLADGPRRVSIEVNPGIKFDQHIEADGTSLFSVEGEQYLGRVEEAGPRLHVGWVAREPSERLYFSFVEDDPLLISVVVLGIAAIICVGTIALSKKMDDCFNKAKHVCEGKVKSVRTKVTFGFGVSDKKIGCSTECQIECEGKQIKFGVG